MKVSKASVINVLGFSSLNPRPTFLQSYSSASFGDPPCTSLRGVEGQLAKAWVTLGTLCNFTGHARCPSISSPEPGGPPEWRTSVHPSRYPSADAPVDEKYPPAGPETKTSSAVQGIVLIP